MRIQSPVNDARMELVHLAAVGGVIDCIDMPPRRGRNGKPERQYVTYKGVRMPAARAVWLVGIGPLGDGVQVLHVCNRGQLGCINVDHLYLGGHRENALDRATDGVSKGKNATHLTPELVREIRPRFTGKKGEVTRLANEYGVSFDAIWNLKRGRSWGWVE